MVSVIFLFKMSRSVRTGLYCASLSSAHNDEITYFLLATILSLSVLQTGIALTGAIFHRDTNRRSWVTQSTKFSSFNTTVVLHLFFL